MADDGYYYLHTNGSLLWKRFRPEDDSSFVVRVWTVDRTNRLNAWTICIEAKALGANPKRIAELAEKWGLTDEDGQELVKHSGGHFGLFRDGNQWCATFGDFVNVQESQCGFGDTVLAAFAELAQGGLLCVPTQSALPG